MFKYLALCILENICGRVGFLFCFGIFEQSQNISAGSSIFLLEWLWNIYLVCNCTTVYPQYNNPKQVLVTFM